MHGNEWNSAIKDSSLSHIGPIGDWQPCRMEFICFFQYLPNEEEEPKKHSKFRRILNSNFELQNNNISK